MAYEVETIQRTTPEMAASIPDARRNYRRLAVFMSLSAMPLNLALAIAVFILFPRLTLNAPLPGFRGNSSNYTDQVNLAQTGICLNRMRQ